jgi:hypothetical protein
MHVASYFVIVIFKKILKCIHVLGFSIKCRITVSVSTDTRTRIHAG